VDRVNNIIYGAALLKVGKVRDARGWTISQRTLIQVFGYGSRAAEGIKARFDHPEEGKASLGTFLGVWKNFRIDGVVLRADLHLSPSAFKTPHGDLATYVMDRAEDAPDSFGVSISADFSKDFDGQELSFSGIRAFDVVEEPAGTDGGMFSVQPSAGLSQEQRRRYIERCKRDTLIYLGKEPEPMTPDQRYEAQYQADLKAMGGRLSVSKADYIASLRISDEGGIDMSDIGSHSEATTATLEAKPDPADDKYRQQHQADKAILGAQLTATEEEYVFSLKATDAGGVLHLH
tara:strand:+ start:68 stop:937 length:870 start_codon:yes stop_codon:yes gene_type:complete